MDLFLNCYLDQLDITPRNSLHDRRNRRTMVTYISTLIEGCSEGESCDREKNAREAVIILLRYHERMRNSNGAVCMMGKYHNILYVAMKICYNWELKDTPTVSTLLEHIYDCEKTFERLFIGAIFGTKAPHYIAGWKSDFDDQEENLRAMVYFIDHATNAELEMPYEYGLNQEKIVRFIDIPIESCGKSTPLRIAAQMFLPDKLHILLRYGALVYTEYTSVDQINIVETILNRLMDFNHSYPYNIVACLQLLLSVIPCIKVYAPYGEDKESNAQREAVMEKYSMLVEDGIIPVNRCGIEPPELRHLCRCIVREQLWKNYQLPNGIRSLPVPESLWRYIDLLEL